MTSEKRAAIQHNWENAKRWFQDAILKACQDVQKRFAHEPMAFFLHHKIGDLAFFSEMEGTPPGWELSDPRAFQGFQTFDQLRAIVTEIARRVPCLPPSKVAVLANHRISGLPVKSKVLK